MENILIPDIDLDYYSYDIDCLISVFNICKNNLKEVKPQDILAFREKKELKIQGENSKFSKNMQDKIKNSLYKLKNERFIKYCEYKNSFLVLYTSKKNRGYFAPKKILSLNPRKELWGKFFALEIYKRGTVQIQIKKLFKNIIIAKSLKPYKIRDIFEENMDNLCFKKIIKSWHYKNIDEASFLKKDWLHEWFKLSITVKV